MDKDVCIASELGRATDPTLPSGVGHMVATLLLRCWAAERPLSVTDLNCGALKYAPHGTFELTSSYLGVCDTERQLEIARANGPPGAKLICADPAAMRDEDLRADVWIVRGLLSTWSCEKLVRFMARAHARGLFRLLLFEDCRGQSVDWEERGMGKTSRRPLSLRMAPMRRFMDLVLPDRSAYPNSVGLAYSDSLAAAVRRIDPGRIASVPIGLTPIEVDACAWPLVVIAIIAKDAEALLPTFLRHIEAFCYPKNRIAIYARTNDNHDDTERMLRGWMLMHGRHYWGQTFDARDVPGFHPPRGQLDWKAERFAVMGRIRDTSMRHATKIGADFYAAFDVDNFVHPDWLAAAVALNMPIVSPLLRTAECLDSSYGNFHAEVDRQGYRKGCDVEDAIISGRLRGLIEVPVAHCSYLIRADVLPSLRCSPDGTDRHEYVLLSESARAAGVGQYLDCRRDWGFLTRLTEESERPRFDWIEGLLERDREIPPCTRFE